MKRVASYTSGPVTEKKVSNHADLIARELIKLHEGLRLQVYTCSAGYLTVGYGRNLESKGLSPEEAEYLLSNDIAECIADLEHFAFWGQLNEVRQAVLIDMRFNLGASGFRAFKNMIAALEAADYSEAASEMLNSEWAAQVKGRSLRLARLMRDGHSSGGSNETVD